MKSEKRGSGALYLAADPETGEAYVVRLIPDKRRALEPRTLPLTQILRVVNYPHQHAIQDAGVAMEFPAIPEGAYVRLAIVREISQDEMRGKTMRSYESSLLAAQEEELRMTGSEKEAEIIRRHMAGEYCRRRLVKSYTREEIKFMAEAAMHTEDNEAGG